MQLEVSPRFADQVLVLDCTGRMVASEDLSSFQSFMKQLVLGAKAVVVNLEGVNYMDSGGLSVLVGIYTSAKLHGGTVKLANLKPAIRDLLRITKLLQVFEVFGGVDDAVNDFRKAAATPASPS